MYSVAAWGNSKLGLAPCGFELGSLTVATVTLGGWGSGVASALDDSGAMAGAVDPETGAESILQQGRVMGKISSSSFDLRFLGRRTLLNPCFPYFFPTRVLRIWIP